MSKRKLQEPFDIHWKDAEEFGGDDWPKYDEDQWEDDGGPTWPVYEEAKGG